MTCPPPQRRTRVMGSTAALSCRDEEAWICSQAPREPLDARKCDLRSSPPSRRRVEGDNPRSLPCSLRREHRIAQSICRGLFYMVSLHSHRSPIAGSPPRGHAPDSGLKAQPGGDGEMIRRIEAVAVFADDLGHQHLRGRRRLSEDEIDLLSILVSTERVSSTSNRSAS